MNLSDRLQQILSQSEDGTTPGPWYVQDGDLRGDYGFVVENLYRGCVSDENAAFIASSRSLVPALARALGVAVEALSFYESRDVYVWPDGWRCRKEGGPPQLEDCEEASEVGENALAEIAKILLPEEKV